MLLDGDVFFSILTGLCCSLIFLMLVAELSETELVEIESENIFALKDRASIESSFFLGSGSLEEKQYIFYVIELDKGKRIENGSRTLVTLVMS